MGELIINDGSKDLLAPETVETIAAIEREIKRLEEKEKALKQTIQEEMEARGIIKLENDKMTVTYVAATDRISFDSAKFKNDHPDQYDEYLKISPVKPSIRIKLR